MRIKLVAVLVAAGIFLVPTMTMGQIYLPVAAENPSPSLAPPAFNAADFRTVVTRSEGTVVTAEVSGRTVAESVASAVLPECSPAPGLEAVQSYLKYNQTTLTRVAAAKLGILFGSVSGSDNQTILVRDWWRGEQCLANDGRTLLLYGQVIRTVIAINDFNAKADLSLAALAANATINRKNSQVSIEVVGLFNPKIGEAVAGIASRELNVETYAEFTRVESSLIGLADAQGTTQSVKRIGVVTDLTDNVLRESVATAFALYQLKDGKSCDQARAQFPSPADPAAGAINQTYNMVMGACNATQPQPMHKLRAEQMLFRLKVSRG